MNLPAHLLKFWYPNSLIIFIRVWRNLINLIEEDLAVKLMVKLLWVPLFHDATIVGRILSFLFRITRVILGLVAFGLTSILIIGLALIWFGWPIILGVGLLYSLPNELTLVTQGAIIVGLSLFLTHLVTGTEKSIWQIKKAPEIWLTTKLKATNLSWQKLISTQEVKDLLASLEISADSLSFSDVVINDFLMEKVWELGKVARAKTFSPAYFFVGLLYQVPHLDNQLLKFNLKLEDFVQALKFQELKKTRLSDAFIWDEAFAIRHLKGVNRGWLGAPTPNLDSVSTDLTKQAAREGFPDFIGRASIISEVVNVLSQQTTRNVLMVGEAGSGKTTLAKHLAKLIIAGDAPEALATKRLVELDLTKLLANVETEGDLAARIKNIFEEVAFVENIIIFVDNIHNLGIGEAGQRLNLYSLMQPYLESNDFQFIAATDMANYAKVLEKNAAFAQIFHKIELPPATVAEAIQIVEQQQVLITYRAVKTLVSLSAKLIHQRVLPDSALFLLEECKPVAQDKLITTSIVKQVLNQHVNVPLLEVNSQQRQLLLNLEQIIHQHLIDQEEAVRAVADTLRRGATALREESRPIGSFLFVGPTGVGKTELAKILASVYFKENKAFMRLDMSEYQTEGSVNRLNGTSDNPGELTESVKNKPYQLILLDEFEKAHPQILTLFLQILEDGRLTSGMAETVDFTNTIIVATSNAASLTIAQGLSQGLTLEQLKGQVSQELLQVFKPELINRFDGVIIFKPLSPENLEKIVRLKLEELKVQLKTQGYLVEFDQALVSELSNRGYNPVLGARPLRRLMQDTLEAKLSKMILENKLKKGEVFRVAEV